MKRRRLYFRRPSGLYPHWSTWRTKPDAITTYIREFEHLNHLVSTV